MSNSIRKDNFVFDSEQKDKENVNKKGKDQDSFKSKIHTMPKKFAVLEDRKSNIGLILVFMFFCIVFSIAGVAYYFNKQIDKEGVTLKPVTPKVDIVEETPVIEEQKVDKKEEDEKEQSLVQKEELPEETEDNTPVFIRDYLSSKDTDEDGLTDVEEGIYTTYVSRPDTDGDGHTDAQEVLNLYNPKGTAPSNLIDSGLITSYENFKFKYLVFYPRDWVIYTNDITGKEIIIKSTTDEQVKISVEDNLTKASITDWYLEKNKEASLDEVKLFTTHKGLRGIKTPNGLIYYLTEVIPSHIGEEAENKMKIYTLEYIPGKLARINFLTTFKMMLESFVLLVEEPVEEDEIEKVGIDLNSTLPDNPAKNELDETIQTND